MIEVIDRVSTYPNKFTITKDDGTSFDAEIVRADQPTQQGTVINRALFNTISNSMVGLSPNNHASPTTEYGVATSSLYGHVRTSNADTDALTVTRYKNTLSKFSDKYYLLTHSFSMGWHWYDINNYKVFDYDLKINASTLINEGYEFIKNTDGYDAYNRLYSYSFSPFYVKPTNTDEKIFSYVPAHMQVTDIIQEDTYITLKTVCLLDSMVLSHIGKDNVYGIGAEGVAYVPMIKRSVL